MKCPYCAEVFEDAQRTTCPRCGRSVLAPPAFKISEVKRKKTPRIDATKNSPTNEPDTPPEMEPLVIKESDLPPGARVALTREVFFQDETEYPQPEMGVPVGPIETGSETEPDVPAPYANFRPVYEEVAEPSDRGTTEADRSERQETDSDKERGYLHTAAREEESPSDGTYSNAVDERASGVVRKTPVLSAQERGVLIIAVSAMLVIWLGFYGLMHRTDPAKQAEMLYRSYVKGDFKAIYPLLAFNSEDGKQYGSADVFVKSRQEEMNANPLETIGFERQKEGIKEIKVGTPIYSFHGRIAMVPTHSNWMFNGRAIPRDGWARMVNQWGIWRLDATGSSKDALGLAIHNMVGNANLRPLMGAEDPAPSGSQTEP